MLSYSISESVCWSLILASLTVCSLAIAMATIAVHSCAMFLAY